MSGSRLVLNREVKKGFFLSSRFTKSNAAEKIKWVNQGSGQNLVLVKSAPVTSHAIFNETGEKLNFLSARQFWGLAAIILIFFMLIFAVIRANHNSVSLSYEVSSLTKDYLSLLETNRQLKTEFAELSSLERLEVLGKENLGLVVPSQGQIVVLD